MNDLATPTRAGTEASVDAKPMRVPFFGLDRQYAVHRERFLEITDRVLRGGQVLQGAEVTQFEASLCAATDRKHAIAVGSCTDALAFALMAGGIGPGDEVLITSTSFVA